MLGDDKDSKDLCAASSGVLSPAVWGGGVFHSVAVAVSDCECGHR